jgi:hypothetical protein
MANGINPNTSMLGQYSDQKTKLLQYFKDLKNIFILHGMDF